MVGNDGQIDGENDSLWWFTVGNDGYSDGWCNGEEWMIRDDSDW